MKLNTFRRVVCATVVPMLAVAGCALAQTPAPTQFSGLVNDYSPATTVTPMGPWEMRGPWTLTLNPGAATANFSATLTMELSDYTRNSSNIDSTSGASARMQHTHHIAIENGTVTAIPTGGFQVSGPATITKDGSPAPLAASTLTVAITGGTNLEYSNITLQFAGGATVHFGSQLIHGVIGSPITASSGPTPGTTSAVVTPLTLTTSQASVVLDASGSTSASGNLQYLFEVAPGGLQAAILQSPSNPKATVDFVNGPGMYLIQLVVTDASGNTSKSPVITLNYQPAGASSTGS